MKLSFRDLKQQKFTIDAEPSETIAQVKEKIAAEKGWEASQQKLIYSGWASIKQWPLSTVAGLPRTGTNTSYAGAGKILADANTVESYNIEEKGFIVCMVSKPKTAPAAAPPKTAATPSTPSVSTSTPASPPAPQPLAASAPLNPPATPSPMPSAGTGQTAPTAAEPASSFNDPSALLVGQQGNSVISQMEAMGFERPQIERAMRAAFFNPDRAIEYLLNGIPESVQAEQRQGGGARGAAAATSPPPAPATAAAPTSPPAVDADADEPVNLFEAAAQAGQGQGGARGGAAARSGAGAAAGGAPTGAVNIDFLRNSPHFQHLRQLVQQQPAMLEPILQQVAEGNPQLAQMIGQNQDQFLQLLSEDLGGDAIGGMGDTGPMPPGAVPISVTEEERDAIERLCRLGFSRDAVVQAYFAFDKNEELAANWLFEQPEDDDQQ